MTSDPSALVGQSANARASARLRVARFDTSRERFANRGKGRRPIVIRFRLSQAARLVIVVRGPGPDCKVAARIAVSGHAGANRVRFNGRFRGRPLEPGTYLLTPRSRGQKVDLARTFVTIVNPDVPRTMPVRPRCGATPSATLTSASLAGRFFGGDSTTVDWAASVPASPETAAAAATTAGGDSSGTGREGIRGAVTPLFEALPPPSVFVDSEGMPTFLALILFVFVATSLVGIVFEVVRQLRWRRP